MLATTVFRYSVLEKLGGWGMSLIYEAQDTKLPWFAARSSYPKYLPIIALRPWNVSGVEPSSRAASRVSSSSKKRVWAMPSGALLDALRPSPTPGKLLDRRRRVK